jgi:hypothetical protein
MVTNAIKIMIILKLVIVHSIFADSYVVEVTPFEYTSIDTNRIGMIRTWKDIYDGNGLLEYFVTIYDNKGNLIHFEHTISKNGKQLQVMYNGAVWNIIHKETRSSEKRCEFAVVKPSSDTLFFNLNPEKEPKKPKIYGMEDNFKKSSRKPSKKNDSDILDEIIYNNWHDNCRFKHGFN